MRIAALAVCGIAALVFLSMLGAIARHRARACLNRDYAATAVSEYVWATVPWLMIIACALPAIRLIAAGPN